MCQQNIFFARSNNGRNQKLADHLMASASMAGIHAEPWGKDFAHVCALVHDIGKYSSAFQKRVRGGTHKVDHSTAGAKLLHAQSDGSSLSLLAAYCIMGHHGGLPNGGSLQQDNSDNPTMYGRLKRAVEDFGSYNGEVDIPSLSVPDVARQWSEGFHAAFFVRMIHSALVDADWLDSENFCNEGNYRRGGFDTIEKLYEFLKTHIQPFLDKEPSSKINTKRTELLRNCLDAAVQKPGLFTLTAPTGSGKTVSSLSFALKHANENGLRRIIYVVPYNTIIEQNAAVFEDILGVENVLRHNSEATYEDDENDDVVLQNKRHSTENWDYPFIITSNVQFFESLFASKPSKCRKLHNIAGSVIIFDEAQMIPVPYLRPCVKAIETLVTQYNCTAVLATATQSALDNYFVTLSPHEITENPNDLYKFLSRTQLVQLDEPLIDIELASRLLSHNQVMCIVNTRRHAQLLFETLRQSDSEGVFHLSTTMYPAHRRHVLDEIRGRLNDGLVCRVISTSLVEAGVDLDFACVYRAQAGLDSIIQAAGRCNREGNLTQEEANVYIFDSAEHKPPRAIQPNIDAYRQTAHRHKDLSDLSAIRGYFEQLFYNKGDKLLDEKSILKSLEDGAKAAMSFPFKDLAAQFKMIDDSAQQTVYVLHEATELEFRLRQEERTRELFRAIGTYAVNLYEHDVRKLLELGAIERLDESVWLLSKSYYDEHMGAQLSPEGGQGMFA